jgi:predicted ArsR family transcriptional regulator
MSDCSAPGEEMHENEMKIMCYLYRAGPAFTAKLALRLNKEMQTIRGHIMNLLNNGYVERVSGAMVGYRLDKRNRVIKHRNHTYYQLTRKGKLKMRNCEGQIEVNLRPPYKQA